MTWLTIKTVLLNTCFLYRVERADSGGGSPKNSKNQVLDDFCFFWGAGGSPQSYPLRRPYGILYAGGWVTPYVHPIFWD